MLFDLLETPRINGASMKCDISETKDSYFFEFEIPGVTSDQIDVSMRGDEMTVTAKKSVGKIEESTRLRSERATGTLQRTFILPERISDSDSVEALYQNGILRLKVPKPSILQPKTIKVKELAA